MLPCRMANVDDFFHVYVNELTNRSKREMDTTYDIDVNKKLTMEEDVLNRGIVPVLPNAGQNQVPMMTHDWTSSFSDLREGKGTNELMIDSNKNADKKIGKQHAANKIAQQKYRERKKQKYAEMEKAVKEMEKKVADLQAIDKRNSMLEEMNSNLQSQMVAKERELERLKALLDAQADASLLNPSEKIETVENNESGLGREEKSTTVSCDLLPRDLTGIDFKTGFSDQIAALKQFMKSHGIDKGDVALNIEQEKDLALMVGRSCQLCQAAIRAEGVRILDLITCDANKRERIGTGEDEPWNEALDKIKMTPEQQKQLLILRQSHLDKMRDIYSERERLNLDAMAMMIPHTSKVPEEDKTIEGRMNTMSSGRYLPLAKMNAELSWILDKIKDNLKKEKRAVMDLNCCTISRILNPVQGAMYMVTVYPQHCDALALSNALARRVTANTLPLVAPTSQHGNGHGMSPICGSSGCC